MTKNVLVLTADAGFGHRAAATAVAAALEERYGGVCRTTIVNPLADQRAPGVLRLAESDYDRLVQETPELYQFGYRASDKAFPVSLVEQALIAMLGRPLQKLIAQQQPDAIVTTYPLYQAPVAAVFAITKRYVPLLTVVTDLATVHALWFNDEVDRCLVPTRAVQERAVQYGIPRERVEITGLPVNPAFARSVDKTLLRQELGWDPERVVVLFAGSKRVTRMEPAADAFNHSGLPLELALVSGGNEALYDQWRRTEWHQPAHVYGYVDEMNKLIRAADVLVCKAGGLIVSEALAVGLPMILVEAIPGQETGNAELVVQGGAGELAEDGIGALVCLYHWLKDDRELLAQRSVSARKLGHPYAAYRVAELTWQAVKEGCVRREHRFLAQVPLLKQLLRSPRAAERALARSGNQRRGAGRTLPPSENTQGG